MEERQGRLFDEDMSIYEALLAHPKARDVLVANGMGCVACMGSHIETIADGAEMHGVEPRRLLDELNSLTKLGTSEAH